MSKDKKDHLWIPDEEVIQVDKDLTARPKPRKVLFSKHGDKLSHELQTVKEAMESVTSDNSLIDTGMLVFSVELPEGEKIKDNTKIFSNNGMQIRAVKTVRQAIVTSTKNQFSRLSDRVVEYSRTGVRKTYFDYIDSFKPFSGEDKDSNELKKTISSRQIPRELDIQLMLIPNLDDSTYSSAIQKLSEKINSTEGHIEQTPYYLSDKTPVIRAIIPSATLSRYENDPAIFRIEETDFFNTDTNSDTSIRIDNLELDPDIDINELPIVGVLDSGVEFPGNLSPIIIDHWICPGSQGGDSSHGTKVASRVVFKYFDTRISSGKLTPRARIIDCNIMDGLVPINIMIQRIQTAVNQFSDVTNIFNLSANSTTPIEGDEMSILGYELDMLQFSKKVQFVISSGNHQLWKTESSLGDILDDDDSRISTPADSMLSVIVGAVAGKDHENSLAKKNQIAPYSRRGPGFQGISKPDFTAYAGTIMIENGDATVPSDPFSLLLTKEGELMPDAGTSFSAPVVAGDLAEISKITPENNILLAKALLYHNAIPLWDQDEMNDEELTSIHNLYGRGLTNVEDSIFSSPSRVTFVRTGSLNRKTKERVTIYMPTILAAQVGRNIARVSVTCQSRPPVDRTKGTEYLGAFIRASLKKSHSDGVSLIPVAQDFNEGREKWNTCYQFTKQFSRFNAGDWQVWLELFSRWEDNLDIDVPYALVVTIEDVSGALDVYNEVELLNRYKPMNTIRLRVDS